jgi:hypothetical protein
MHANASIFAISISGSTASADSSAQISCNFGDRDMISPVIGWRSLGEPTVRTPQTLCQTLIWTPLVSIFYLFTVDLRR